MRLHELVEARKNPEANPKISINQAVAQAKDQPNTFISFTEIDKLGINPKSKHETPIGIYAYPIKYVAQFHINLYISRQISPLTSHPI